MTRSSLPQNLVKQEATSWFDCETLGDWVVSSSGGGVYVTADSVNYTEGTQGIKITNKTAGQLSKTYINITPVQISIKNLLIDLYVEDVTKFLGLSFYLIFEDDSYLVKDYSSTIVTGWNYLKIQLGDMGDQSSGGIITKKIKRVQFAMTPKEGQVTSVTFDNIRYNRVTMPKVVIGFDDAYDTVYSEAYSYMSARNIKGTVYINSETIDAENRMTLEQLNTVYTNGWDVSNHTSDHTNLTTLDAEAIEEKLTDCQNYLLTNGFVRSYKHLAYPYNAHNATVRQVVESMVFLTARASGGTSQSMPYEDAYQLKSYECNHTTTFEALKTLIDTTLKQGDTLMLYIHDIVESPGQSTEFSISIFQQLIDYLIQQKVDVVPISEWHRQLTNPRKLVAR